MNGFKEMNWHMKARARSLNAQCTKGTSKQESPHKVSIWHLVYALHKMNISSKYNEFVNLQVCKITWVDILVIIVIVTSTIDSSVTLS